MTDAAQNSETCEFPDSPNDSELVRGILNRSKTIAVIGLSHKENRDSHRVAAYLKEHGYTIVPVNPASKEILGEICYKTIGDIPFKVDVVDVFRKPSALPELAEQIAAAKPGAVWFQVGIVNDKASKIIRAAGIDFVQNLCMMAEHRRLLTAI